MALSFHKKYRAAMRADELKLALELRRKQREARKTTRSLRSPRPHGVDHRRS